MASVRLEPALAKRLEKLTGEDPACCTEDLRKLAEGARATRGFDSVLLRAKALADEKRLLAAALIKRKGELCACEIQAALGLTHATVSHHMASLEEAGLVTAEKRGRWTYYSLTEDAAGLVP